MITITVNGQLEWTGSDSEEANRRLDQVLKAQPSATIELWDGGKSKLLYQPSQIVAKQRAS